MADPIPHNFTEDELCGHCALNIANNTLVLAGHIDIRHMVSQIVAEFAHAHPSENTRFYLAFRVMSWAYQCIVEGVTPEISASEKAFADEIFETYTSSVEVRRVGFNDEQTRSEPSSDDTGSGVPRGD